MKKTLFIALTLPVFFATGCASVAVSNDSIVNRTSIALSIDKSAFTISDRVDSGVKTTYNVKTNSGDNYSCYVTGGVSVVGRTVSDAICSKSGAEINKKATEKPSKNDSSCNALLKAAGKCS